MSEELLILVLDYLWEPDLIDLLVFRTVPAFGCGVVQGGVEALPGQQVLLQDVPVSLPDSGGESPPDNYSSG